MGKPNTSRDSRERRYQNPIISTYTYPIFGVSVSRVSQPSELCRKAELKPACLGRGYDESDGSASEHSFPPYLQPDADAAII